MRASISARGTSPSPSRVVAPTWTTAPPGSSIPSRTRATRAWSIQWKDCARVATRNVPSPAGSCPSAQSRTKRSFADALASASRTIGGLTSIPIASSTSGARRCVSEPGPHPTSR